MFKQITKVFVAIFATAFISSAVFAEELKSPAEWMSILENEEKQLKAADPELEKLELGAGFSMVGHSRKPSMMKKLPAFTKEYIKIYKDFMAKTGYGIIDKLASGTPLEESEKKYKYICVATFVWVYKQSKSYFNDICQPYTGKEWKIKAKAFFDPIRNNGEGLIKKCFLGEKISRDDIDTLRLYLIFQTKSCSPHFPTHIMPYLVLKGKDKESQMIGKLVPKMEIAKLAPIFQSPDYTDEPPLDQGVYFRPEGLKESLGFIAGITPINNGDLPYKRNLPIERLGANPDDYVDISSFVGKKPVLLISACAFDSFCISTIDLLNNTYEAYKDKVEVFIVNTTIGDISMGKKLFYGDYPGKSIRTPHPRTMEERARQTKVFYMDNPFMTIPYLQDDMAHTTQDILTQLTGTRDNDGGNAATFLIDIDGRLVYPGQSEKNSVIKDQRNDKGNNGGLEYRDNFTTDHIEQLLAGLMQNEGRFDPIMLDSLKHHQIFMYLENMVIISVDKATQTIKGKDKKGKIYNIKMSANTRISIAKTPMILKDLADDAFADNLKPGSKICVSYKEISDGLVQAASIYTGEKKAKKPMLGFSNTMKISARITAIDKSKNLLTVQIPKPAPEQFPGYVFWKDAGDKATLKGGRAVTYLPIVKKIIEGTDEDRTFTLVIDAGVDLLINGRPAKIGDLQIGNHVGVKYFPNQHNSEKIYPEQIRINRIK